MKILLIILAAAIIAGSCNNSNNTATGAKLKEAIRDTAAISHQQVTIDTISKKPVSTFPIKELLANYLQLKNALANDNAKDAAKAGDATVAFLSKISPASQTSDQSKNLADLLDDIKENTEHIGANAAKIQHQREHFIILSKDIADLVKMYGNGGQILYKDFCPMINDGKGAFWISEIKEIKNPYLGKKMPGCGTIKETIQ